MSDIGGINADRLRSLIERITVGRGKKPLSVVILTIFTRKPKAPGSILKLCVQ